MVKCERVKYKIAGKVLNKCRYISPPFEGGVAGPLFNFDTNADTGRGG